MEGNSVRQFVVVRREDVPGEFVPLVDFGPPNKKQNGTPEYIAIQRAWSEKRISGCKWIRSPGDRFGPVFVDGKQAARIVQSLADAPAKAEHSRAVETAPADGIDGAGIVSALRSMLYELRRIGNTLETISQRAAHVDAAAIAEDAAGEWDSPDRE